MGGGALYAPLWFFALYSKNLQETHTSKIKKFFLQTLVEKF